MITFEERQTKHVPGITSFFVSFKYNKEIISIIKSTDVSYYNKKTFEWEVPLTSLAYLLDRLILVDDVEVVLQKYKDNREYHKTELHKHKTKPFKYQEEGIQFGLAHDKWLLLDAPGLGKTLQCIYLAEEIKKRDNIEHCLIICGVNTLKTNWKKEIQKHSSLDCIILGERITKKGNTVFDGVQKRIEQLKKPIKEFFVITNIESLRNKDIIKLLNKGKNQFDMIVLDEAHCVKDSSSQQGSNLLKLKKAKYKVGATGTLLMNAPLDAYVPLKWIGAERAAQSTCEYYYCIYGGPFGTEFMGYKNLDTLKKQLEEYALRRDKSLLDLPPKYNIVEYVDMNDAHKKFYENIKSGVIEQVDKVKMNTSTLLAMVTRLRQATACPSILTTESIVSSKLDRAQDLAEQVLSWGEKVVVFSTFKDSIYELKGRLSKYHPLIGTGDIKDEEISKNIDTFQNDPNEKVFLGTWQKCGTGITLTSASYMIFVDTPWTASMFTQACDRIYRIGTDKPVFIYNLVCNDTIDERVLEIINDKEAISDYVIDDKITDKGVESLKKYILELR